MDNNNNKDNNNNDNNDNNKIGPKKARMFLLGKYLVNDKWQPTNIFSVLSSIIVILSEKKI